MTSAPPNTPITLDKLLPGETATVKAISPKNRALCDRLLALGLVAGRAVRVIRIAPLGDPIKIEALGGKLSLRRKEAEAVEIVS